MGETPRRRSLEAAGRHSVLSKLTTLARPVAALAEVRGVDPDGDDERSPRSHGEPARDAESTPPG